MVVSVAIQIGYRKICYGVGQKHGDHGFSIQKGMAIPTMIKAVFSRIGVKRIGAWLDLCYCQCSDCCQCNLLGSRGDHHPRKFYTDLWGADSPGEAFPNQFGRTFRWDSEPVVERCEYSRMLCHYPFVSCNKHAMNDRMAPELSRLAIDGLVGFPVLVPPKLVLPRKMPARRKPLCKMYRGEIGDKVSALLKRGEQRRSLEPPPKRVAWEKRPRWNKSITILTPVTHDVRPHDIIVSAVPC